MLFALPATSRELPVSLQGLGLREHKVASRELPGWQKPERVVVRNLFGQDAVPATFEVVYLTAWAPHETQQQPLSPGSARSRLAEALEAEEKPLADKARPK